MDNIGAEDVTTNRGKTEVPESPVMTKKRCRVVQFGHKIIRCSIKNNIGNQQEDEKEGKETIIIYNVQQHELLSLPLVLSTTILQYVLTLLDKKGDKEKDKTRFVGCYYYYD